MADLFLGRPRSRSYPKFNIRRDIPFVDAAVCSGHSRARIVFSHLLPVARPSIEALFPNSFVTAIQVLAGLSFLGLGVWVLNPEWGVMIQQGAGGIVLGHWWIALFPVPPSSWWS